MSFISCDKVIQWVIYIGKMFNMSRSVKIKSPTAPQKPADGSVMESKESVKRLLYCGETILDCSFDIQYSFYDPFVRVKP